MILDRLEHGHDAKVYVFEPHCQHPTHTPLTSYTYGCRCARCGYAAAIYRQEHTMTDIDDDDLDAGNEPCADCDGTGIDDLGNNCEWCRGTGVVET